MQKVTKNYFFKAALFISAAFLFSATHVAAALTETQKAIREAESLSVVQDRLTACSVLTRALKKASPSDSKILKAKLVVLAKYFYTDKGFQAYLSGKELFEKKKYSDAMEKLTEADELEKSNSEVLELLSLAQFNLNKFDLAIAAATKGLLVCPIDIELLKTKLSAQLAQEKWQDVLKTAEELQKDFNDTSAQVYFAKGLAVMKTADSANDAEKWFDLAIQKDPRYPEPYYWLASIKETPDAGKLLTKYAELCKNKAALRYEREPALCSKQIEVEAKLKPSSH